MWKSIAALLLTVSAASAQNTVTAYGALRVVSNQLGQAALNHVVSLSGTDGNPQPRAWRIVMTNPKSGGTREVIVSEGRMSPDEGASGTGDATGTINTAKLNLDSSGAYEVASKTADSSHVPFSLVSYKLRNDERGNPTWVVTLQNQGRRPLGSVFIGANKGTVSRTEGMFEGLPTNAVVEEKPSGEVEYTSSGRIGPIKDRARALFGHARDQAQVTFKRVRHNFADFIRGSE